jgi:hypothetical protein
MLCLYNSSEVVCQLVSGDGLEIIYLLTIFGELYQWAQPYLMDPSWKKRGKDMQKLSKKLFLKKGLVLYKQEQIKGKKRRV